MSAAQLGARIRAAARMNLTRPQATRLLKRSILGPRKEEIDALVGGNYEAWLDQQLAMPVFQPLIEMHLGQVGPMTGSYARRARLAQPLPNGEPQYVLLGNQGISTPTGSPATDTGQLGGFRELCLKFMEVEHPDVLRHRTCRALLEILVASVVGQANDFFTTGGSMTGYYTRLQRTCFTTFRDILRDISLSPEMAIYLTYSGNAKANTSTGAQPDENYAREIMQLFSIGLFELNLDGTRKKRGELDPNHPEFRAGSMEDVPTYGPDDIKAVARIFTGTLVPRSDVLTPESSRFVKGSQGMSTFAQNVENGRHPNGSLSNIEFFSTDNEINMPKQALPGVSPTGFLLNVPGGVGGVQAFDMLLDALVNHPSCAPYISKRLIQLLTCSNPRPEYVARVASVFRNNGAGVVGDMKAVLKAIFLDQDALAPVEKRLSIKTRDIDLARRSAMRALTVPGIIDPNAIMVTSAVTPAPGKVRARDVDAQNFSHTGRNVASTKGVFQAATVFGTWPVGFATPTAQAVGEVTPELHTWDEAQISSQSAQTYKGNLRILWTLTTGVPTSTAMADANVSATFDRVAEVMAGIAIAPAVKTRMLAYIQGVTNADQRFDRMVEALTLTAVAVVQE